MDTLSNLYMDNDVVVSKVTTTISDIIKQLANWSIPKEKFSKIYEIENFDFIQDYCIKTCESTISINQSYGTINLLSKESLGIHKKIDIYILDSYK
jgi:hypothetical protein